MVVKHYTPHKESNFQEIYWKDRGKLLITKGFEQASKTEHRGVYHVLGIKQSRLDVKNGNQYSYMPILKKLRKNCKRFLSGILDMEMSTRIAIQKPLRH
tara:strand:+ start:11043 stop:11339 length:297 start_codon:yes stop_codon:yes gene_type:complete